MSFGLMEQFEMREEGSLQVFIVENFSVSGPMGVSGWNWKNPIKKITA